ncbi:ATP-dependent RNA helicase Spb4 [Schizosaccharomyces pombe]|uniref:ATP-dependent rRNA helicase spb4 n=1 Tax=Schizosaccharomyces pombe (strain 972 / ATCC 24843) TaxID=284812 RepID=SPB4_SCHPO|nr:putative ATP-dependent RNA helicase Spb4 [Schizosaccharomyces pombe]O74764.1 RecName: Full=ATP-dependent rRNA helicase spb4 [Schizosaccharomyces pombe 972h-]CAA21146.1 ATP-dependent RNA helicase Spb4 (predicted) [Schizosaccharomyces pombe]|eukprot:NP_595956.1 putative ATP-dependent RNA helicase Spb4 [Schizosaccharomyces pombe]
MSFQSINIDKWLKNAVAAQGFKKMTPVQANAIPLFLKNKDLVVEAVTGSGKTLAYLLPCFDKVTRRDTDETGLGALIVAPTRELATQIFNVTKELLAYQPDSLDGGKKLVADMYIGGKGTLTNDLASFREKNPSVVIGTPGRLNEMLSHISSKHLEILILDEADTLIDMGFQRTLQSIISQLPKQRRTGLFSATMNDTVSSFLKIAGLRNSVRVSVTVTSKKIDTRTPSSLAIQSLVIPPIYKVQCMIHLLCTIEYEKAIVFFSSCASVEYFNSLFLTYKLPFEIVALHGQQVQSNRSRNFEKFKKSNKKTVLFTTDIASRGLDIPNVDFVLQLDPPLDPKSFSHRCGRAGRAGRAGVAIVLLNDGREEEYEELLRVRKVPITRIDTPIEALDLSRLKVLTHELRKIVSKDRDLYDKGLRAFVSHVRAYTKHHASFIFRIKDLDLGQLATAYALLHLPKMPELKDTEISENIFKKFDIDYATIPYRDQVREQARRRRLEVEKTEPKKLARPAKIKNEAWSKQKEVKEKRNTRREKRKSKKEFLKAQKNEASNNLKQEIVSKAGAQETENDDLIDEESDALSELEEDYRQLKKSKKRKNQASFGFSM